MQHAQDSNPMALAAEAARKNLESGRGGPFGAAVVKDGEVIAVAANSVLATCDPTAHAEVNAIRQATSALGTHDLSGCELYATSYPCPMCLSAAIWANIGRVRYALSLDEASDTGFRDSEIYDMLRREPVEWGMVELSYEPDDSCSQLHAEYRDAGGAVY